jgi:hypothetical protein
MAANSSRANSTAWSILWSASLTMSAVVTSGPFGW